MYFVFIYENRKIIPDEIVLRSREGSRRKTMESIT
jgi:hypothetical protein